jgi:hypothetical protein
MDADDVDDVSNARYEAEEILYLAVLKFISLNENNEANNLLRLLGLQFALLRTATRVALIQEDNGAQNVRKVFLDMARAQYDEVSGYRVMKPRSKSKPPLKVVK